MFVSVVASVLMLAGAVQDGNVVSGVTATGAKPAVAEAATPDVVKKKDKLVCKSQRTTGSRMATRVCKTNEAWEERRAASLDKLEEWQREPRRPNTTMDTGSREAGGRKPRPR